VAGYEKAVGFMAPDSVREPSQHSNHGGG
jgi:hypothetical protein